MDVRFFKPFANQLENLLVGPARVVKSRCVYKNDVGSVSFVVQNTRSLEILGDGPETVFSPPPRLAGQCINYLFDEYSKLVETIPSYNNNDTLDSSHFLSDP